MRKELQIGEYLCNIVMTEVRVLPIIRNILIIYGCVQQFFCFCDFAVMSKENTRTIECVQCLYCGTLYTFLIDGMHSFVEQSHTA